MPRDGHSLVFVGGLHRSGTTLLARCLADHPQVSGFSSTGVPEDEGQHLQDVYVPANRYGGAGLFALAPEAHLTETSPLATAENAERLWSAWSPHWDLGKPRLVEKSPPNIVMTRFLQALYPDAHFVMVVRHPVIVALSTTKWTRGTRLTRLFENWFRAHDLLHEDAPQVRRLHVVKYENLIADPATTLRGLGRALELDGDIPAGHVQGHRSATYETRWSLLQQDRRPWRRRRAQALVRRYEARADAYGYSLVDLDRADPFPT